MKKTPAAQLEREIAWYLFGEEPVSGHYYVVDRGRNRTMYGPFETRKDAEYAGYFAKPVTERDSQAAKGLIHVYFMIGVQQYDADEVKALLRYPEEYELKSAKLKQGVPPMHSLWRAFDREFREEQRDKDYDFYQRSMRR